MSPSVRAALTPPPGPSTIRVRSELQARGIDPRPAWSSFLYHQTDEGRQPVPAHLLRGVYPR